MKQQLAERVPKDMELTFPRKDVVQLKVHWEDYVSFFGFSLVALIMLTITVVLLSSIISTGLNFVEIKIVLLLATAGVGYFCWHQAKIVRKGYAQITLTPKEIQKQLYYDSDGKKWGDRQYMRWRDLELFMPLEVARAKEINVSGEQTSTQSINKQLNWQELGTLRMWVNQQFKSFFKHYNTEQEQYLEQWMQVQYQYYRNHPEVDQLEPDYFLKIDETEAPLLIDLSQHLIDDGK